jgi:predicted nucleic acid-binding protein
MTVVSDASPMINLARIEALHLLAELHETVVLPEAVWTEIVVDGEGQPGARAVQSATWIERQAVANRDLVRALRRDLDKGEAEAVALAVETEDVLLLMDERLGRETADHFDLACVGLIGVLIEAKECSSRRKNTNTSTPSAPICRLYGARPVSGSVTSSIAACYGMRESFRDW